MKFFKWAYLAGKWTALGSRSEIAMGGVLAVMVFGQWAAVGCWLRTGGTPFFIKKWFLKNFFSIFYSKILFLSFLVEQRIVKCNEKCSLESYLSNAALFISKAPPQEEIESIYGGDLSIFRSKIGYDPPFLLFISSCGVAFEIFKCAFERYDSKLNVPCYLTILCSTKNRKKFKFLNKKSKKNWKKEKFS